MEILWFLPTQGDGRHLGTAIGGREVTLDYLTQVARAADDLGYSGVLVPTGRFCEDPWVAASAMVPVTRRLKFLVAVRPGIISATVAARMTTTFDRISGGRLLINVVTGGDPVELAGDGSFHPHDQRYALTREFMEIWQRLLTEEQVDFAGDHLRVEGARIVFPQVQRPHPPIYIGGSSDPALDLTADIGDAFMTWGEPPALAAEKIADVRQRAAARGRSIRVGMRLHVIVRDTDAEAWAAADDLIKYLDDDTIKSAQASFANHDSVGQKRMTDLHGGDRDRLVVSPNLWAGVGLVRGGAGTAIVGDPETVAARLKEYRDIGVDLFILSGYPHLEEAYRFAELVFPLLPLDRPAARSSATPDATQQPRGEVIGFDRFPVQPAPKAAPAPQDS